MPERTMVQIVNELEQAKKKLADAEATMMAQRPKITELVRELSAAQGDMLKHFGLRIVLENARDGLPEVPSETRRRGPKPGATRKSRSEQRSDQDAVREWAGRTEWVNPKTGKPLSPRGPVPIQAYQDYDRAIQMPQPPVEALQAEPQPETQQEGEEERENLHALPPEPPKRTRRK